MTFVHPIALAADRSCIVTQLEEVLNGKTLNVKRVTGLKKKSGFIKIGDLFDNPDEVILGITPSGHCYLMVGNVRYDGQAIGAGIVRDGITTVSDGTLIRLVDLPSDTVEGLKNRLLAMKVKPVWSSSCYAGACTLLDSGGVHLAEGNSILPTSLFKSIFGDGLVDVNGRPISMEIYRLDNTPIQKGYNDVRTHQTQKVGAFGFLIVLGGYNLYLYIQDEGN